MRMRIMEKTIAVLLVICMLFSFMPTEMMSGVLEDVFADIPSSSNFQGTFVFEGEWNPIGPMSRNTPIIRVVLSRDSDTYLNGSKEAYNNMLNAFSYRYPISSTDTSKHTQNTLFFSTQAMYDKWTYHVNITGEERLWKAPVTYYSGNPTTGCISKYGEDVRNMFVIFKGSSKNNTFKTKVVNAYNNKTIGGSTDLAGGVWKNYLPTQAEAYALCSYLFTRESGFQERVLEVVDQNFNMSNLDVKNLDNKGKFNIIAGYTGLLSALYVVADAQGQKDLASAYDTAIEDYLSNNNIKQQPVTLIVDTCLLFTENNGTRHIMPSIDVVEYSLATNSNFSILDDDAFLKNLEKAGKRKTTITSTSGRTKGFSLREQIEEMAWASLEAYPFATTKGYINGSNDTTQKKVYRLADLPNLNSIYTNQQHGNPLGYCLTVVSLAAASDPSGKGRGEMFTSSGGPLWNSYDWGSGHFLDIFYTGENGFLDGFAIMGSHMSDPNPSADFTVVDTLQGSPDTCEEFVQLITPTKITVNIGNGSDFLAFLDTLPEDSKISLSANISRTEYKNSLKGAKVDYIEHLTALENDLFLDKVSVETFKNKVVKTIILEDDYFLDSSGSPKTYTRSTNDASLVIFEYAIDLTLTVDETVYEFKSDDIVSRIGDVPQNSSSFQIKAYKSNTTPAEDIEIIAPEDRTKPNYTHNPSAQEDLAHNTQVVRWYEFTSVMGSLSSNVDASFGSTMGYDDLSVDADIGAFAEIKSNTPGDEKYEVLGGIPSTEELYFSVGGSEWKVSMIMQYWMNEHSRDRTYTMHFDGTTCEFNNNQKDNGDIWEGITLPSASGASQSTTRFEHTGTTVTATWTGTIYNGNASVSQTDTQTASGCGGSATAKVPKIPAVVQNQDYVAAVANANAWMQAMANLSTNLHWKAASDEVDRDLTITAMNMGTGKASTTQGAAGDGSGEFSDRGFVYGSYSYSFSNPADVDAVEDTVYTSCITHVETSTDSEGNTTSTTVHDGDTTPSVTVSNHGSANTSYSITVTYTIEAHTICGPCCGHVLPDLWDTWKQGLVFDYMKISQIRLFLLDQGSVEGMTDLTGTDRITASVVSGNPTYFMNIATHTEQIRDPYMTAGGTSDLEGTKQGNTWFTHTEYSSSAVYGELPHLSTYNTREAQSSRAGRIRYLLDANWEATATKSFNYQYGPGGTTDGVGGNKSGTLTIDYNKVANSKHHDDVVYDLGTRTPNCDGMATTANFGKEGTKNETPMLTTGHVNKWADGMLYTNIMDLEDFSTYWDTGSYGNSYTPTQMRDNDKNLVKFKEDYGHHNPEDGLTKTGYGHHADIVDSRTAEWQVFDAARKTKIVAVVISDFLIMQTSGGDQAVFYYEKASEPTEAQEHFQKVSIPEEELTTNNPLSVFNAGAVCESSSLKEGIANFEIVGGYNGRYDVPSKKYMPYSLVTKQFLSNNSNSWSVYNTSYQISNGKITNADKKIGVESNYNKYGNSKIVTIFDDDPAGSFNRPARQAEGTGLKIYQDNLQILPTTPNKYYQPNNASIWYIQVLGMFSAGGPYYNHATGTYNVHTAGNVNLGHPYREKYGSAWTDYWGVEFGLQLNTKYYLTPNGDSNTGTVNGVVVYTPVSAEDAIILPQGDLNVNGVTVSRDQRVDNFAFPNMNEIANALKVCTLDPATCEYRYLDCKYLHDTVVAEFDFEDSYSVSGKTYVTNNITGIEYALPSGYSVSSGTSFANSSGRYLVATGTNSWSIPFADLGLSNDKTNRVKVSMDLYVTTSARDVMISGFRNLGFIVDTSGQGKFIIPELNDPTMLGTSKSFTQNMKKVHLDIVFGFNNIIDCTAYVNGVEATVHQVVDFRNQWTETVVNGQTIRKLEQTHVVLDANALRTTPPRNLSTGDIMASLNIGTWGNTESTYNASFYLDNLSVVLMGGSTEHTSACYVTATTHAVSKVHVCDENCYLQSDLYTCDGLPNANYQLLCGAEPMTYTYKGFAQSVTLTPGTYRIEAWGASGGGDPSMVGQGGYTAGTVTLTQNTTFYIYVGQQGTRTTSGTPAPATFNGGGNGVGAMSTAAADAAHWGGSGGGATDIRLVGGDWNNTAGLQSRILVAGGGGGSGCASSHNPGHGGGLTGVNTINSGYYFGAQAYGGTQTAGGYGNGQTSTNGGSSYWSCDRKQGSFGKGADAAQCGAGGGGGYYGGGSNYTAGGGGGSSYVTGYTGCDTTYRSQQGGYNFTDVVMAQGGNTGNGKVAITKLDSGASLNYYGAPTCNNLPLNTGTGTKTLYKFVHASGCTYSGYTHYYTSTTCYCGHTCNRQSATVTLNAGEYVWYHNSHYADYHISTSNTKCTVCGSSTGSVIVSNPATSHVHSGTPGWTANGCYTTPTEHRHEGTAGLDYANGCYGRPTEHKHTLSYSYVQKELTCTIPVGGNGDVQTFDYTGNIQSVNLPAGRYKLEVWGAQGGGHSYGTNQNISYGGYGGYSYGTITLSSPTVLYVVVGGSGGYTSAGNYTSYHNGYNGGGTVTAASNGNAGQAGGGGATHIATATGLLSSLSSNRSAVLIVAGGGGGTEHVSASSEVCGGAGGGLTGGIATKEAGSSTAATQSSGYSFGQGQGVSSQHMGSGGGGWYGGYAGTSTNTIGNGGSGYIGGVSDGVSESGKRGNNAIIGLDGYAKITNLDHQHTDACYKSTTVNHNSACPKEAKGTYKCTGEPNTLTDFNVHVHDINCFYNYYDLTPRTYQATGGVITYMVPYTDVYKIETWGAANQDSGTRSGYASGYVKLTRGTRLYFYIGTKDGFNDGNTDIRTYDIMYSYDEIMDMESGADRHEWLLAYEQSLASRFINAGGNQAESFVRNVGQYSLTSGVTSTVGNSSDGRIIITPQNRLPLEKDDTYILEQIIQGDISEEQVEKYLGKELADLIINATQPFATFENFSWNNYKGIAKSQNNYSFKNGNIVVDVAKGGCYEFILPVNISARALRRVVVTFDNYTSSTNFGLAINQANDAHRILKPITANKANQTVEFNVRDLAWDETVTKLIFNPSTNTNLGKVVIKKIELFGHAEYTEFTPNSTYTYDNIATITGFSSTNTNGFVVGNNVQLSYNNSDLRVKAIGSDPITLWNSVKSIPTGSVKAIKIVFKNDQTSASTGQLFYKDGTGTFNETDSFSWHVGASSYGYQTVWIDCVNHSTYNETTDTFMTGGSGWTGTITGMRFDWTTASNATIDVKEITFIGKGSVSIKHTFNYLEKAQAIKLTSGKWNLDLYGAQGGDGRVVNTTTMVEAGGKGGRTQGTLTANGSTTYYVYVGGKGGAATSGSLTYGAGGWNGGAPGGTELSGESYPENGAGGGGMTHITTSSSDMLTYKGTFGTTQVVDIPKGTQYTFNYTGSVQSIKLPKGEWKIEAWGAQGGGEANQSYSSHAGLGGYTSGIVNADGNTTYYIYVGGQGTLSSGLGTGAGWNGGGHGGANGYGGGGMTHITTSSTDAEGTTNINVNQSKTVSPLATPVVVKTATSGTGNVSLTPGIYYLEATGAQGTAGEGGMASGWLTVTSTGTYYYSVGGAGAYTWVNSSNSATNALVKAGSGAMAGVAGVTGGYTTHTHTSACGSITYSISSDDDSGAHHCAELYVAAGAYYICCSYGSRDTYLSMATPPSNATLKTSAGWVYNDCGCGGDEDYSCDYDGYIVAWAPKTNYTCNNLPLNDGYITPVPAVTAQAEQTSSTYNLKEGKTVASASIQQSIKITRYVDLSGQTIVGNVSFTATNGYTVSNSNLTTTFGTYTYKGAGEVVSLPAGTYIIEAWGAQGGSNTNYNSTGKSGGYVKGTYSPSSQTDLFIVVGGAGGNRSSGIDSGSSLNYNGGFNGGGSGSGSAGPGGGGATHIQIGSTGNIIKNNYGNSHTNTKGDFKGAASSMSNLLLIAYGGGAGSNSYSSTTTYMNGVNGNTGYYNSGTYLEDNGGGGAGYKGGACGNGEDAYYGANGTSYVNTSYLTATSTSAGTLTGDGKVVISRVRTEYTSSPTIGDVSFTTTISRTVKSMTFDTSKVLIVAGGGGGADNVHGASAAGGSDDGSGGAGGGTTGGNALIDGVAQANTGGTQSSGYGRGVGETVTTETDTGGGGGGWYGGKVTNNNNGGAGGGSGYYNTSKVSSGSTQAGKREGDGYVVITLQKDIMKDSNTLGFTQTYSFDTTKVIAVAGGGGGASGHLSDTTTVDRTWGGNGGGTTGATTNTNTTAGTQSSGYEKQGMGGPGWSYNYTGGTHLNYGSSGGGGGGWYGGYTSTGLTDTTTRGGAGGSGYFNTSKVTGGSTTAGVRSGNGLAVLTSNGLTGTVALNAGPDSVTEVTFTTGTYTGTPFKATYVNPFENETARQTIHNNIDLIPTLVDGDYNPIFVCKFQEKNAHECQIVNDNGTIQNLCVTTVRLDCTEPHHKGVREGEFDDLGKPICREHYAGGNRICWSACGNDDNHKLTKNEVDVDGDGTTVLQLAEFLQIDEGFTVYFPNRGNFYGNGLLGLASPQTTRGYGYKNNMDTTRWTREKRVMFPFTVLYEGLTYNAYSWIELDVNEEYFNFYLPVSTPEVANGRVVFEVEAINCGTKEGTNPLFNITYSSTVDNNYTNALNTFIDGYLELYQNSVKRTGYKIIRAQVNENKAGAGHRLAYSEVGILAFIEERQDRVTGPTSKLIKALEEIDRQVEYDFERDRGDYINPNNANTAGSINERLKPLTMNDNLERYDNTLRSDAYQSLHGGYKKFYLDILGRIGNFAITDTEDFRFSNFFKVAIVSNDDTAGLEDPNNWLVDGLVKQVDENVQNYYVGDLYDIRGNKASVNTRWLDTYGTQSWMAGTITENGDRNVNKKNLVSQILTGDVNTIEVLEDHELSYGYDIFTSIVTFGSYQEGQVQIIPKYYALKVSDKNLSGIPSKYNVNKGVYVPLDVYVNKDGAYEPVNIFGNASNGNKNKAGVQLSDYVFNLDWTNEAGRRNYSLDEQARTNRVKEFYKTYIYDYNNNMQDPSEYTPSYDIQVIDVIEYTTPDGEFNYLGTPQYILMDGRHRTFIGDSKSYDNNAGGHAIWSSPAGNTDFGLDKGIFPNAHTGGASQIDSMEFERAVQRWHSKIGLPSSAVFVPHGETVNATTLEYIMGENEEEWVIVCTAEIIAVGAVWNLNYSQPWFNSMTVGGETFKTHQHTSGCTCNTVDHYPGHRIGDTLCPWCIDPIIAVFGKTSVNDVEISQIY